MYEFTVGEINYDFLLPARLQSVHPLDTLSHEAMGEELISGHYIEHTFLMVTEYSKECIFEKKNGTRTQQ